MSAPWSYVEMDVTVDWADVDAERERVLERGGDDFSNLTVIGSIDLDEALEEATVDQLRAALGREEPGYTLEQLDAIGECFAALAIGDERTAVALLPRVFEHEAQRRAAEQALQFAVRRVAA